VSAGTPIALIGSMGCSTFLHASAVTLLLVATAIASRCGDARAIRDLRPVSMEASLVVLPAANKALPDRASRVPVVSTQGSQAHNPIPDAAVKVSDLAFKTERPEENAAPDLSDERRRLAEQLRRMSLLDSLAPDGPVDREATDPLSDASVGALGAGRGDPTDPEWARYVAQIQRLFMARFRPLTAITSANPSIRCSMRIEVDGSGRIIGRAVAQSSGVPSYDMAAERAVDEVGTIPLPPARYLDLMAQGYLVNFVPP
jgi:hypothetical protein